MSSWAVSKSLMVETRPHPGCSRSLWVPVPRRGVGVVHSRPMTAPPRGRDGWTIALVACSTFVYEILLTRVGSLRLEFHYGYLVIAVGLLAMGSAGSWLAVVRPRVLLAPQRWLAGSTLAFALSLPLTWVLVLTYPVPTQVRVLAEDGGLAVGSLAAFFGFAGCTAIPFFTGGLVIGMILMLRAAEADRYYAADLAGAALGGG